MYFWESGAGKGYVAYIDAKTWRRTRIDITMKVAFIHPDLGIGGAERLVVDAALALQNKGHDVTIFTSHHDPKHAFDETRDGTLKVQVYGNSVFPRNVLGKLSILCATLRQLHLTKSLVASSQPFDIFIVDQLPATVPYLRKYFTDSRILFYCHHPDLLLTSRTSILKKLYRLPFDSFERWCTAKSDQIAVNSEYTRKVFFQTFGNQSMPDPAVVYPVVDATQREDDSIIDHEIESKLSQFCSDKQRFLLSINRFERKKDIDLAISAFSLLLHAQVNSRDHLLIIAGGYDERVKENIEYLDELQKLASKFRIPHATKFPGDSWAKVKFEKIRILFLPSVSSPLKNYLLNNAAALLYTPTNEHFGIVPLEAMKAETPVLATNTGGPLETIVDGVTGWLREPDMEAWYHVIDYVLMKADVFELKKIGKAGRERVLKNFGLSQMEVNLDKLVLKTKETERKDEDSQTRNTNLVTGTIIASVVLILLLLVFFLSLVKNHYSSIIKTIYW